MSKFKVITVVDSKNLSDLVEAITKKFPNAAIGIRPAESREFSTNDRKAAIRAFSPRPPNESPEERPESHRAPRKLSDSQPSKPPAEDSPSWQCAMSFVKSLKDNEEFSLMAAKNWFEANGFNPDTASPMTTHLRRGGFITRLGPGR